MLKKIILSIVYICTILCLCGKDVPPMPSPPRLVNDYCGTLSPEQASALENKLRKYSDSTSTQLTVVIEPSLEGDDVFDYSFRLAQSWGLGEKGKNNGVLIYFAMQERKIRIQVGYGLEAKITDAATKQIIEHILKPAFKERMYYEGIDEATNIMIQLASGEYKGVAKSKKKSIGGIGTYIFLALIILYIISKFFRGGSNYGSTGGPDIFTAMMLGSMMGRGGGHSYGNFSSGSGSFGGFGGGSFGGGGSGGDW
ncbi:MAG: TPM domain-containing protein [Cytophagales bacterium]|nr:TPM domain-containing protein [Cytophagales bacterium]